MRLILHVGLLFLAAMSGHLNAQKSSSSLTTAKVILAKPIRLKADGKLIDSAAFRSHSGPAIYDINHDGLDDLVVGNYKGHFQVYLNIKSNKEPEYKGAGLLKAKGKVIKLNNW